MLFPSIYWTTPVAGPAERERLAAVLLIVLVILSIFASVGLAFILYAESEARSSSSFRDSTDFRGPDLDPEMAFSLFLQQLIFDCKDDSSGAYSSLRGHSLLRNMYGLNYTVNPATGLISLTADAVTAAPRPFNGTGRLHWKHGDASSPVTNALLQGADDYYLPQYAVFPKDGFVRHPERIGVTAGASPNLAAVAALPYRGGFNPPYTAVDMNCMALAAITAEGKVLAPSFHRDYSGISLDPADPTFKYWAVDDPTRPWLKYAVLRPRYAEHPDKLVNGVLKKGFPAPEDKMGDVRNRPQGWPNYYTDPNNQPSNDSVWLYTGSPVFTLPDGRKYTMLFAPLMFDLDSKLNINVVGNSAGPGGTHASSQSIGPWEINLSQVLSAPSPANPARKEPNENFYLGTKVPGALPGAKPRVGGKFDYAIGGPRPNEDVRPTVSTYARASTIPATQNRQFLLPHFYGPSALNPSPVGAPPTMTAPGPYKLWPVFANYDTPTTLANLGQHPLYHNSTVPTPGARAYPASEMHKLLRVGDTNTDAMLGDLWQLLPENLKILKNRGMITTLSFDRREPGLTPWLWSPSLGTVQMQLSASGKPVATIPLPSPTLNTGNIVGEYGTDWRGLFPDLKTPLLRNPATPPANVWPNLPKVRSVDLNRALLDQMVTNPQDLLNHFKERQQLAKEIYELLIKVTGAPDPYLPANPPPPAITSSDYEILRYLAQLAVNIVDFIDSDDIITPFNWGVEGRTNYTGAGSWVYGTELPNVVINEVYCQYSDDPANDPIGSNPTIANFPPAFFPLGLPPPHATFFNVDLWVELCNPFKTDSSLRDGGTAKLWRTSQSQSYAPYRLMINQTNSAFLKGNSNTDGRPIGQQLTGQQNLAIVPFNYVHVIDPNNPPPAAPTPTALKGKVDTEFNANGKTSIGPLNEAYKASSNQGATDGFYVVGPADAAAVRVPFPTNTLAPAYLIPHETIAAKGLRYKVPSTEVPAPPTILLQRLLCPYLPESTNNPYITVDYFEVPAGGMNAAADRGPNKPPTPGQPLVPKLDPENNRKSYGRVQPYMASPLEPQAVTPLASVAQTTFFFHNKDSAGAPNFPNPNWPPTFTAPRSFDWLVHLDRNLISPMELLHVSGYRPHQLTQQFNGKMGGYEVAGKMIGHQAPWFDDSARLYRLLEFVQTRPLQVGYQLADTNATRIPGKININTIWGDPNGVLFEEIFLAMADPPITGGSFTGVDLGAIWSRFLQLRNPSGLPGPTDQYIMPLSAGVVPPSATDTLYPINQFPIGMGISNTLLGHFRQVVNPAANTPNARRLFEPPSSSFASDHPYKRFELLTKIFNNITTRSNCFALWVTAGFFEVNYVEENPANPEYGRIYLGQELGRADGRNIRHKMFAIIDRSVLDSTKVVQNVVPQTFLPATAGGRSIAEDILNQRMVFNPQLSIFRELVPFFTIVE